LYLYDTAAGVLALFAEYKGLWRVTLSARFTSRKRTGRVLYILLEV
jgi:hypothetical protein